MKLERLSQNKIKYSISFEELSDKGFLEEEFESFIWHDLFDEMVEVAKVEYQFEVPDTISIEIFSLNSIEIVLILTIDDIFEQDENVAENIDLSIKTNEIYSFESIDDVISLAIYLDNIRFKTFSKLYMFEDKYFLIFTMENIDSGKFLFDEFGMSSEISRYLLEEYGNVIIENNALEVLYSYFKSK